MNYSFSFTAHVPPGSALPHWATQDDVDTFDMSRALADTQANSTTEVLPISTATLAFPSLVSQTQSPSTIPRDRRAGLTLNVQLRRLRLH